MAKRDDQKEDLWAMLARISDLLGVVGVLIALGYSIVALYRSNWTLALDDLLVVGIIVGCLLGGVLLIRVLSRRRARAGGEALPRHVADRSRAQMLEKVRATWMPVLEESLQDVVRMELGLKATAALVEDPRKRLRQPNRPERLLPPGTPVRDVFDELAGELLILGAPGAGKTTMLLELARDLLDRARQNPAHPIPVVFNLASWAAQRPPLDAWLVDELNKRYDVPRRIAQAWVDAGALLPLLDGLDEVVQDQREACVEAINHFHEDYGPSRLVVCSRIEEYEALMVRLRLQGAVAIQPLELDQIDAALAQAGARLDGVRTAIRDDVVLQELAATPLLFSVMILAYQDRDSQSIAAFGTLEDRRDHLFAAYVDKMFERRGDNTQYLGERTRRWLVWLARGMKRHSQTTFYIEQLQPDWLPRRQQWAPTLGVALGAGLVGGLFQGLGFGLVGGLIVGLFVGLLVGLGLGLRAYAHEITSVEALRWSWSREILVGGLVMGLGVGLVGGLIDGLLFGLIEGLGSGLIFGLLNGLGVALLGGLGVALLGGLDYGGLACIQHLVLRLLIYRNGSAPWNYARFLDHCAQLVLLHKVGGGYIFVHRMLMEYFAALKIQ